MVKQMPGIETLLKRATAPKHSPLYLFLRENHPALSAAFKAGRPDWKAIVEELANLGVVDGDGKPPQLRTAQQAWYRVCHDLTGRKRKRIKKKLAPAQAVASPVEAGFVRPVAGVVAPQAPVELPPSGGAKVSTHYFAPVSDEDCEAEYKRLGLGPVSAKDWTKVPPDSETL